MAVDNVQFTQDGEDEKIFDFLCFHNALQEILGMYFLDRMPGGDL